MPVTIKSAAMKFKAANGSYVGIDAIADATTAQQVAAVSDEGVAQKSAIQTEGAAQQAAIVAKGAETLESIPSEYTELSNDVNSLKSALNKTETAISYEDEKSFTGISTIQRYIQATSGKWADSNNPEAYMLPVSSKTVKISITANANTDSIVALLNTNDITIGGYPDYATGQEKKTIEANTTEVFDVPSDCHYIFIAKSTSNGSTNRMPQNVTFMTVEEIPSVDNSLSVSGSAADAKSAGDAITDLRSTINGIADTKTLTKDGTLNANVTSSGVASTSYNRSVYSAVDGIKQIKVTKTVGKTFRLGFTTVVPENNVSVSGYVGNSSGTEIQADVPNGAKYVVICYFNTNTDSGTASDMLDSITITGMMGALDEVARAKAEGVNSLVRSDERLEDVSLPFNNAATGKGINCETGAVYNASNFSVTDFVDVQGYSAIIYRMVVATIATKPTHGMAFYDASQNYISGVRSLNDENAQTSYTENTVNVPNNAKYARFTFRTDTETHGDFYVKGENILKGSIKSLVENNGEAKENSKWMAGLVGLLQRANGKFNVAARMRMLTDIEWKTLRKVPKQYRESGVLKYGSFEQNENLVGIPYGAQLRYEQWIGKCISFETFLSALKNPNSCMYDFSRVGTAYRQSAWYSVNCSKAVGWALNLANTYASGAFASDPNIRKVANAGEYAASDIQIGDIIEKTDTHTAIVTDLIYNTMGELSQIEVSEATTPLCRRKRWNLYGTLNSFYEHFDGYYLLRYDLIDNVPPIDMEAMYPYISETLGLYLGNKSNYSTGDSIEITLLSKVSNTLNIRKNGVTIGTIDVTNYDQSAICTYQPGSAGWYEIGFDGDDERNRVGFCVNDNTASFDPEENKLEFSSTYSTLNMVSYSTGTNRAHLKDQFPTAEDLENGYMTLNVPNNTNYIHAIFANDYGKTLIEIVLS